MSSPNHEQEAVSGMSTETPTASKTVDPVLLSVLSHRFDAVVREMTNTLLRSARSAVLGMARDLSCSIVTADNRLLASIEGIPVHVFGSHIQTQSMCDLHPQLTEGDAYLHNDPYMGNTHSADHTILVPVFHEGEHLFTAVAKAHQADAGNSEPTTYMPLPKDLYEEGALNFPCVKVQEDYENVEDVIRMCRRRIRVPDQWYGDYLATLGSARIGERKLKELSAQYGPETVKAFIEEWFAYSERRIDHAIRQLPAAKLTAVGHHDRFVAVPEGLEIKVTVDIDPDAGTIDVDLRDNPDCVPAGINQSAACATNNAMIGVFNSLPPDIPHNAGSFRRINVHLRENCIAGIPLHPTSCSMATTNISGVLVNTTQRAFAQLGDGYGLAEGGNSLGPGQAVISGRDWRDEGAEYVNEFFSGFAGGPASAVADGWLTFLHTVAAGVVYLDSIELNEQKYPVIFRSREVLTDSGGAGRRRGAPGTRVTFGPTRDPMMVMYATTDAEHPPLGVHGGLSGGAAGAQRISSSGQVEQLDPIPLGGLELEPGEWVVGTASGGGGYGSPLEREPERVLADVLARFVSPEQAEEAYGVVLRSGAGGLPTVDHEATERERATRAA
jgi:N-methylhydantoinase B